MKKTAITLALLAATGTAQAINIEFDYTYDSGNFFTESYRNILDTAGLEIGARITDSLAAITSTGGNTYQANVNLLISGGPILTNPISVAEDTIRVYVGARTLDSTTLGIAGNGYNVGYTTQDYLDLVQTRGQNAPATDNFTPTSGQIVFDNETNWYLDDDVTTVEAFGGYDFYSVVVHELAHVLGVGTSDAWTYDVSGNDFVGANALASYGGPVPLADSGHVDKSIQSTFMGGLQEPALTPSIASGQRKYLTDLDWALLADVGWQVTAVPEAQTWAMMLAGLGLLGWRMRRRA